jgi:hypothetical protein
MHLVFSIPYSAMSRPRALHSRIWINGMRRCMARSASGNRIALLRFGALWEQDRGRFQDGKRRGLMAIGTSRSLSAARHQRHAMRKEGEAVRLVKRAWRMGYRGLAGALAVAWDSSLSPVDMPHSRKRSSMAMPKDLSSRLPAPRLERRRPVPSRRERNVCSTLTWRCCCRISCRVHRFSPPGGLPGPKGAVRAVHQGHVRG